MNNDAHTDIHEKMISLWLKKNAQGLETEQLVHLLQMAIHSVTLRAGVTLSKVTLMVIIDRVVHQSKDKYPILKDLVINFHNIEFEVLNKKLNAHNSPEALSALQFLLTEQLRVLGRLTANVLTAPLHKEVMQVMWKAPEKL